MDNPHYIYLMTMPMTAAAEDGAEPESRRVDFGLISDDRQKSRAAESGRLDRRPSRRGLIIIIVLHG